VPVLHPVDAPQQATAAWDASAGAHPDVKEDAAPPPGPRPPSEDAAEK